MVEENDLAIDPDLIARLEATKAPEPVQATPEPEPEPETILTAQEVIEAFESTYQELVILRNAVVNLHERLEKIEQGSAAR